LGEIFPAATSTPQLKTVELKHYLFILTGEEERGEEEEEEKRG